MTRSDEYIALIGVVDNSSKSDKFETSETPARRTCCTYLSLTLKFIVLAVIFSSLTYLLWIHPYPIRKTLRGVGRVYGDNCTMSDNSDLNNYHGTDCINAETGCIDKDEGWKYCDNSNVSTCCGTVCDCYEDSRRWPLKYNLLQFCSCFFMSTSKADDWFNAALIITTLIIPCLYTYIDARRS